MATQSPAHAGPAIEGRYALVYVPHGGIPDGRGFSPSIVACELAKRAKLLRPWLVCSQEKDSPGRGEWHGIPLDRLGHRRVYRRLGKWRLAPPGRSVPRQLFAICQEIAPAVLHVHQIEFDINEFRRRSGLSIPIILHAHVLSQRYSSRRGAATQYIAVSNFVAKHLADMGYPAERIITIRNGVDTQLFAPPTPSEAARAKERLGVDGSTPVLAFVGRKHDVKGYPAFLMVAERLLAQDRPLLILGIGADPERPTHESGFVASRERQKKLVRDPRFRLLPAVPQAALAQLYQGIDVTLLPSRAETQGMAMIESLAAGCITISSRVGGIVETIEHGVTGYLADDPLDVDFLYRCTSDVLDRLNDLAPLRAAARSFALEHLDWAVGAARVDALYNAVIPWPQSR